MSARRSRFGELIGVLRLGYLALVKMCGSASSLRLTSRIKGRVKVNGNSRSFAALRMTTVNEGN